MRTGRRGVVAGVSLLILGCASTDVQPAPMSAGWQKEVRHFDGKKPPKRPEGIKLNESGSAVINVDKEGKPRLFLGEGNRVSADVNVDSDKAEMRVKMKREWGGSKKVPQGK